MTSLTEIRKAIEAANEKYMTIFSQGDAAGIAALFTESGQFMPPNSDIVTGKRALQALFQAIFDGGIAKAIKLETHEVVGYDDTVTEVGRHILEGEGGQVLDQGKYIVIWKQEAGQWKVHRNIFNSSLPATE